MRTTQVVIAVNLVALAAAGQPIPAGDAQRGADFFRGQHCDACHSISGQGGKSAPDLARRIGREYTPVRLASLMWNHAPAMWSAMARAGVQRPQVSEQQASDLFAFFYSTRYFDRPGEASRGKRVFASKRCATCHGLEAPLAGGTLPISQWVLPLRPVTLAQQMWNHASQMQQAFIQKRIARPKLTSQDLTDLVLYLQTLPQARGRGVGFALGPAPSGQSLFQEKGCAECHRGRLALENRLRNRTLTDIAAAMWNHAPKMAQPPPALNQEEMQQIVSYIWTTQFFHSEGSAAAGKILFAVKKCAVCHNDPASGAPDLKARRPRLSAITMITVLWSHGPAMLERMKEKKLAWPEFRGHELADLLAYLNSMP